MILIGMLHHRKSPTKVNKSYAYAAVSKAEGAELVYFSPKAVDFDKRIINGYVYKNGEWEKTQTRFPDVIYNSGSPVRLNKSSDIINELKKEIPFTTHSIGNKIQVYKRLYKDGEFAKYLIPSQTVFTIKDFMKYLVKYQRVVFKPVNGHKGQGISFIEIINDHYQIKDANGTDLVNQEELTTYIKNKLKEDLYLVQLYVNCKTRDGYSYDFRLHSQKNEHGKWVITSIYPRIGPRGSIVSNISSGGSTNYLEPFLKYEFSADYYNIKNYLEQFCILLSKKMDELQLQYFDEQIDELGIDVGIDNNLKLWLFEVNWRPGCPPAFYLELDVVRNMIRYAMYLVNKEKDEEKNRGDSQ